MKPLNSKLAIVRVVLLSVSLVLLIVSMFYYPANFKRSILYLILFSTAIFLTDFIVVNIPKEGTLTASTTIMMSMIFLIGKDLPFSVVMFSTFIGTISSLVLRDKDLVDVSLLTAKRIIAVCTSILTFYFINNFILAFDHFFAKLVILSVVASTFFITERAIETVLYSLRKGLSYKFDFFARLRLLALAHYTFAIISLLMVIMFKLMDFWSILIFSLPLAVIGQSFKLYSNIRETYKSTIKALSATIEAQDAKRVGHAQRVSDYCADVGRELGFYGDDLERLSYAALLHDIGKLGFDAVGLKEKDPKTSKEGEIPSHAEIGAEIVNKVDYLKSVSSIIKYHHCSFSQNEVDMPLESRIIHIVDAYDHLVNGSKVMKDEALKIIEENKGFIYDPKVIRAFKSLVKRQGTAFA